MNRFYKCIYCDKISNDNEEYEFHNNTCLLNPENYSAETENIKDTADTTSPLGSILQIDDKSERDIINLIEHFPYVQTPPR
jgi:hypothetical protein